MEGDCGEHQLHPFEQRDLVHNQQAHRSKKVIDYSTWRIQSWSQGGFPKTHKFEGLVKVGASKGVIRVDLKKAWPGGFPGNQKTSLDTPLD